MLPFLKNKEQSIAGVIIKNRKPDNSNESEELQSTSVEDCAKDLIEAIHSKDASKVVEAIKAIMNDSSETSETKVSPHTYEAQNIKAGQE